MNPLTIPAYNVATDPGIVDVTEHTLGDRAVVQHVRDHVTRHWRDRDALLALVTNNAEVFRDDFAAWLPQNMAVWVAFEREAHKVWNRGRRHYSARTLVEVLRHESALADTDRDYKINGNVVPDLARLYRLAHPERADLFECRVMPCSERAA